MRFLIRYTGTSYVRQTSLDSRLVAVAEEESVKMLKETRGQTGSIRCWYSDDNGYGFIHPDDGGEAVFAHYTCIAPHTKTRSLNKGVRVTYEVARRKMGGLWAKNIRRID